MWLKVYYSLFFMGLFFEGRVMCVRESGEVIRYILLVIVELMFF